MAGADGYGLEHLPYGVFRRGAGEPRVGVRYGDDVLDLSPLGEIFRAPTLNPFMAQGRRAWEEWRDRVRGLLERGEGELVPLGDVELQLPFAVADYVDFYSSLEHATNMGRLFRPEAEALLPNWRWLPVGYHGRAGTVVLSGTPVTRPNGQAKPPNADRPAVGPSRRLDLELELGFVVGVPSRLGDPVPPSRFADHVFGVVLLNDWSARDIQAWEYQPLGPFLGKSFATSIGAWVTPLAALEPYRVAGPPQEPPPLPHLRSDEPWALDLELEVEVNGAVVSRTNARGLYWSMPQQLAHATSNGAMVRAGDLMASGTISGGEPGTQGSLLELWRGERFLENGDEAVLRGRTPDGAIELADVRGRVEPARPV
jgi:fumarylacetoacetase